ncbi:hypothetical protein Lgee_0246 [Legionella geestiana]|uniref:Uncharacterized protein n=1 Tax=Legionella geestiana TaxID=45065 RepID=A0A0W0U8F1_9GAMM|nr:hypothetical protein Lgee_0246 [Legionella geestiana]STX53679.1 Uncharacterised protein [Legionella geestiana]
MQGILYAACMCQNIIHANGRVKICVWASLEAAATVFAFIRNTDESPEIQRLSGCILIPWPQAHCE